MSFGLDGIARRPEQVAERRLSGRGRRRGTRCSTGAGPSGRAATLLSGAPRPAPGSGRPSGRRPAGRSRLAWTFAQPAAVEAGLPQGPYCAVQPRREHHEVIDRDGPVRVCGPSDGGRSDFAVGRPSSSSETAPRSDQPDDAATAPQPLEAKPNAPTSQPSPTTSKPASRQDVGASADASSSTVGPERLAAAVRATDSSVYGLDDRRVRRVRRVRVIGRGRVTPRRGSPSGGLGTAGGRRSQSSMPMRSRERRSGVSLRRRRLCGRLLRLGGA